MDVEEKIGEFFRENAILIPNGKKIAKNMRKMRENTGKYGKLRVRRNTRENAGRVVPPPNMHDLWNSPDVPTSMKIIWMKFYYF